MKVSAVFTYFFMIIKINVSTISTTVQKFGVGTFLSYFFKEIKLKERKGKKSVMRLQLHLNNL